LLVGHNQALVPRALNVEELDDGTGARAGNLQNLLVDVARVLGSFLEEALVTDDVDVGLAGRRVGVLKLALVDEVAPQLLVLAAGQGRFRAEALDAVFAFVFRYFLSMRCSYCGPPMTETPGLLVSMYTAWSAASLSSLMSGILSSRA
jgi:hypothetical protein